MARKNARRAKKSDSSVTPTTASVDTKSTTAPPVDVPPVATVTATHQPPAVTPGDSRSPRGSYCTYFVMEGGGTHHVKTARHADLYEHEYRDTIKEIIPFDTLDAFTSFSQQTIKPSNVVVKMEDLNTDEMAFVAQVKRRRLANAPTRSIRTSYKTSSFSTAVVLFIDILDQYGKPMWYVKARDFVETMKAFVDTSESPVVGTHTLEILNNMEYVERRNREKGDNVPDKVKGFMNYKTYSHFVLPLQSQNITSQKIEDDYIVHQLTHFGQELKRLMASNTYTACLRNTVAGYSEKLEQLTFAPVKGYPYQTFIQMCDVAVAPIVSYTDHVIKDRVGNLHKILHDHNQHAPKYDDDLSNDLPYPPNMPPAHGDPSFHECMTPVPRHGSRPAPQCDVTPTAADNESAADGDQEDLEITAGTL